MKKFLVFFIILTCLFHSLLFSNTLREKTKEAIEIINKFGSGSFEKISELFTGYKDTPAFYFLQSYKLFWDYLIIDYNKNNINQLENSVLRAIKECEKPEYKNQDDVLLFRSCGYLFLSQVYKTKDNFFKTFFSLETALDLAKKIKKKNSKVYDVSVIIGTHYYYQIFKDKKYESELQITIDNGYFFNDLARFILGKIYLEEEKKYPQAIIIFEKLKAKYQNNPVFLFYLAKSYEHNFNYEKSIINYDYLINNIYFTTQGAEILLRAHFSKANMLELKLNNYKNAVFHYTYILDHLLPENSRYGWLTAKSHFHIGMCSIFMSDYQNALTHLEQVKKSDDPGTYNAAQEAINSIKDPHQSIKKKDE